MKYIVIGLGNYGGKLAEELTVLGHEVIGVDVREHYVDHRFKSLEILETCL